jgi:hypothetical protein
MRQHGMFATPTTVKTRTCIWEVSGLCFEIKKHLIIIIIIIIRHH